MLEATLRVEFIQFSGFLQQTLYTHLPLVSLMDKSLLLWHKQLFQLDGVIKFSSRWENIECSFGEDIGIVIILRRKRDVFLVVFDGELSG